jgi:hypothetical protein
VILVSPAPNKNALKQLALTLSTVFAIKAAAKTSLNGVLRAVKAWLGTFRGAEADSKGVAVCKIALAEVDFRVAAVDVLVVAQDLVAGAVVEAAFEDAANVGSASANTPLIRQS